MTSHGDKPGDGENAHYGLRLDAGRSWTVYHVFTGIPADIGGEATIGLRRTAAAGKMRAMNLRSAGSRARITLDAPKLDAGEIDVLGWR